MACFFLCDKFFSCGILWEKFRKIPKIENDAFLPLKEGGVLEWCDIIRLFLFIGIGTVLDGSKFVFLS